MEKMDKIPAFWKKTEGNRGGFGDVSPKLNQSPLLEDVLHAWKRVLPKPFHLEPKAGQHRTAINPMLRQTITRLPKREETYKRS
jgi:hypothetical protein